MNRNLIAPFKSWTNFIITNLFVGFVIALFSVNNWSMINLAIGTLWGATISLTQWLGHVWIQDKIEEKYSWFEKPTPRFIWTFISIIIYSILAYSIVNSLLNLIVFQEIPWYLYTINKFWFIPIIISLFISVIAGSVGFFKGWKEALIQQEQLKVEMLNYKYESLKNQINPHFMFNSMNVLSELVYDDQKLAVSFIQQFSDIYRYVLDKRNQELVSIKEELEFIKKYIFLLKIRFEDKLDVQIELPNQENEMIVPLSLQLLIENAVKHNEVSKSIPLTIIIKRIDKQIRISNPIKLKQNSVADSKLIGLKNLIQQYNYFSDEPVVINSNDKIFEVNLPIINTV